jgi:very-short-patch-repair endonuclease
MEINSSTLRERARSLRRNQTDVEGKLWSRLRSRQLRSFKFRRQHPIGPFITDFCCFGRRLVVELDGGQHASQTANDQKRTAFLVARGYRVLRFWDNEVMENIDGVLQQIVEALGEPRVNLEPSPVPSPRGRGSKRVPKNPTIQNRKSKILNRVESGGR